MGLATWQLDYQVYLVHHRAVTIDTDLLGLAGDRASVDDEGSDQLLLETPSTSSLAHGVARSLIARILSERFPPGEPLPAAGTLAREYRVSRPVAREALKELAAMGMVENRQGRHSRVTPRDRWNELSPGLMAVRLEVGEVEDIMTDTLELRRVIETEAAALAATRASPADLAMMRHHLDILERDLGSDRAYAAHDVAFHDAILKATHNRLFGLLLEQVGELLRLARAVSATSQPPRQTESQAGHRAVFAAIEAHSPEDARHAMENHLGWAERVNVAEYRAYLLARREDPLGRRA